MHQHFGVASRAWSAQAVQASNEISPAAKPPLPDSYDSKPKVFSPVEQQGLKGSTIDDSAHEDSPACNNQAMLLLTLPLEEAATDFYRQVVGNLTGASLNLTLSCEEDGQKELSIDFRCPHYHAAECAESCLHAIDPALD